MCFGIRKTFICDCARSKGNFYLIGDIVMKDLTLFYHTNLNYDELFWLISHRLIDRWSLGSLHDLCNERLFKIPIIIVNDTVIIIYRLFQVAGAFRERILSRTMNGPPRPTSPVGNGQRCLTEPAVVAHWSTGTRLLTRPCLEPEKKKQLYCSLCN